MSTFRRRLLMLASAIAGYVSAWFRSEGWFRGEAW